MSINNGKLPKLTSALLPVHITLEEFEIGGVTLKTHQMFSVHTEAEEFKNTTTTGHFRIAFDEKLGQGDDIIIVTSSFSKSLVVKMFSVNTKTKSRRFNIPPV